MCKNDNDKWWKEMAMYCQVGLVHSAKVMSSCVEIIPAVRSWLGRQEQGYHFLKLKKSGHLITFREGRQNS
jgi:hypothetical protein